MEQRTLIKYHNVPVRIRLLWTPNGVAALFQSKDKDDDLHFYSL